MSDDLNGQGWNGAAPPQQPQQPQHPQQPGPQPPYQPFGQPPPKSNNMVVIILVLVVLGIVAIPCVGIVAAIAIPNFLNAKEKGMQRRSMSDIMTIATAVLAYSEDTDMYPEVHTGLVEDLAPILEPDYIFELPTTDAWGSPYEYHFMIDEEGYSYFQIISRGRESEPDDFVGGPWTGDPETTNCFSSDMVWEEENWYRQPQGKQRRCH